MLDTNLLVHAFNASSPHHARAKRVLHDALESRIDAYVTPQILYEFFAVVTDSRRVECPLSTEDATKICTDLWVSPAITILEPQSAISLDVFELANSHGLRGAEILDCVIAATARACGISRIITQNVKDFAKFDFLGVVNPFHDWATLR